MRCRYPYLLPAVCSLIAATSPLIAAEPPVPVSAAADIQAVSLTDLPARATEPQAAVGENGDVYLAFGADEAVYCSVSRDGGRRYEKPIKVAEAGSLSLGMRRGPRIAVVGKSVVISAVYGAQGKGSDGDLLAWRSTDGGKTWQGPTRVNDVVGAAREGLHAMTSSPDGRTIACAWLDLRQKGTQIYLSVSRDEGATWGANTRVYASPDGHVCECCHPSVAFGKNGDLWVMWRNWQNGARDMFLARSGDGGKTFGPAQKLGDGTWPLKACPMDGGGIALTPDGRVTTVWRRDQEMFVCEPGKPETLLGRGQQGWAAATAQGVYAAWLVGRPGRLMLLSPGDSVPRQMAARANDPMIVAPVSGHGPVIVAWSEGMPDAAKIYAAVLNE